MELLEWLRKRRRKHSVPLPITPVRYPRLRPRLLSTGKTWRSYVEKLMKLYAGLKLVMVPVVLSLFLVMSLTSCASAPRQPVHVPESLRAPVAAPDVPEDLSYSQLSGYAVRALGALEAANKQHAAVLQIVDEYNSKK
ncbi:hypothetical protein Ahp1_46 [Aeromonas phage Ahp1]|uniref:Uncharacterized protein n=1 Tax=Aeromonas phage Ahp1 TaxID=1747286 RepID=A0A1S5Q8F6_9CAUD|nr:hypothetical protein HOS19_gp46 [Aeromonas phage Ahp1]ALP47765.1 hypothetical protein Ahp1_46 [Aeromonas phage Ahp1]